MIKYLLLLFVLSFLTITKISAQRIKAESKSISKNLNPFRTNTVDVVNHYSGRTARKKDRTQSLNSNRRPIKIEKVKSKKLRSDEYSQDRSVQFFHEFEPKPSRPVNIVRPRKCYHRRHFKVRRYITISHRDFPLRIENASIDYYGTQLVSGKKEDLFELKLNIDLFSDNYAKDFGILIEYSQNNKQRVIFNSDSLFLEKYSQYAFSKIIKVKSLGYVNIRIGYYNERKDVFYVTESIINRTDFIDYIRKGKEKLIDRIYTMDDFGEKFLNR